MSTFRKLIDTETYRPEEQVVADLITASTLSPQQRQEISAQCEDFVTGIRTASQPGLMEVFLAEYGLSTEEGVALMCLAEALLRVPDAETIDALIEDKIAPSDWGKHMGHSTSPLVNASTWGLMLTGKILQDDAPGVVGHLRNAVKRLGEPVIRTAVSRAMKEMGRQFVLGETIDKAMTRAATREAQGYTYSYDMLGEAAKTDADAKRYHLAYSRAILSIAERCTQTDIRRNPGISVKLSALHPRYEVAQRARVMDELVPRLRSLALLAKSAGMGLNIDAEEADRLALSMDVIETVLSEPALKGWDGFGVVVQAYGKRANHVIRHLYELAERFERKIMVRLVKGAYWDTEIKLAQVEGLDEFPVFTNKAATDVSYIVNAETLMGMTDRIYPQFATHNAHTMAAILSIAKSKDVDTAAYEFQRLHGMGETLHEIVKTQEKTGCRIYAPVGPHRDLLAYLVRRLLENGANSSFVNQVVDETVPAAEIARDPFEADLSPATLAKGTQLFAPERINSKGFDLSDEKTLAEIENARAPFQHHSWTAEPQVPNAKGTAPAKVVNPSDPSDVVGHVRWATLKDVETAFTTATPWTASPCERARILNKAADLFEEHYGELFALLHREAGKTLMDAVAELREGVDFLRYYATQADTLAPCGRFVCISPWNFPLAIFTGQISAALAAGNAVLAKPAEQTPLIAHRLIDLMHQAGVPKDVLFGLPGAGDIGAALTSNPMADGVAFTGSTDTAKLIRASMASNLKPEAPLIAETGGLNAMIVDSTALPEQAVTSIIESAFQSAGQRCSALRCLYVQEDVVDTVQTMLIGAMNELTLGNPWDLSTDSGPVIDTEAQASISAYIENARLAGHIIHELPRPHVGHFISPTLIKVTGIQDLEREIFGPVLHIATFKAEDIDQVIEDINATGYGLTFGLHTRIDDRVDEISTKIQAGNIYVNRNQIGAIVGSQPFGGEGLSGTGPKAGGPLYLSRFRKNPAKIVAASWQADQFVDALQLLLSQTQPDQTRVTENLPGPTGEANQLTHMSRLPVLCLGPSQDVANDQANAVRALGGTAVAATGHVAPDKLTTLSGFSAVVWWGDHASAQTYAQALASRDGPILPFIVGHPDKGYVLSERHVCIDTTASGGNAALLAGKA